MDWDERFAKGDELHGGLPSPPLPMAVRDLAPGSALDLAAGAGRHALYLAERGWKVHAIDGSRVGIQRMLDEAHSRKLAIEAEVADLESPDFAIERDYDLICDFYFLHRPLFEQIRRHARVFVAAIHVGEGRFSLAPGELESMVRGWGWTIRHSVEGDSGHRRPSAQIIAARPAADR